MNDLNTDLAGRYICFTLGTQDFAIPLLQVKEVIGNIEITPIPQSPSYYKGIMNLRGQVIPVIDLRTKLGIQKGKAKEVTIIILDFTPHSIGVIVDSIESVNSYGPNDISAAEESDFFIKSDFILGVAKKDKRLTMILHLKAILNISDYPLGERAQVAA
jgi:purine-binding chemotaxis protein CheW